MKPISTIIFYFAIFIVGCSPLNQRFKCEEKFFIPAQEMQNFQKQSSELTITLGELHDWDRRVQELFKTSPLKKDGNGFRLYAYLYVAQKAFADSSFALTTQYSGTLDPISFQVVQLFYPEYKDAKVKKDVYSEKLSALIMKQIRSRFQKEEKNIHSTILSKKEELWQGHSPIGACTPSFIPWVLQNPAEFQSPEPPKPDDPFWQKQLEEVQNLSKNATEEQKQKSLFWANMLDPEAPDWKTIAQKYLNEHVASLEMQLEVRAKLATTLVDALIAVFHDKYAYQRKRPYMLDSTIKTPFSTPHHPTYPAAHATISNAAMTILSYYFPENQKEWRRLEEEACRSRLWAGIHFPIDIEAGKEQGQQVAKAVLFR